MKVYDCFLLFDEIDLLEIRLNILDEYVDFFVIVEAGISFQGNQKKFNFELHRQRFSKFLNKILYFKIPELHLDFESLPYVAIPLSDDAKVLNQIFDDLKKSENFNKKSEYWWGNDFFQRECLRRALLLNTPKGDDLILLSDLDEIPNPDAITKVKAERALEDLKCFRQFEFCYYLNYYHNDQWLGTCSFFYEAFKNKSFNAIRFALKRDEGLRAEIIENGGWHLTSIGSIEKIANKIQNWGHKEFNNRFYLWPLKYNVLHGNDIFRRKNFGKLVYLELDDPKMPKYLRSFPEVFIHLFGPKILSENIFQKLFMSWYFIIVRIWLKISKK